MQTFGSHPKSSPTRRLITVVVGLVAAVAALVSTPTLANALTPNNLSLIHWQSGAFSGFGPGPDKAFGTWRGLAPAVGVDYLPENSWASMDDPTWEIGQWTSSNAKGITPLFSLPLWPSKGTYSFAEAAAGDYNQYFVTLAKNLVSAGLGNAILRLAWEPDGNWYRWSITNELQAQQYAEAWRQIVGAIQQVPGQHFGFDWCMNMIPVTGWSPADAYPGNQYVTEIGEDVYDFNQPGVPNQAPADRWNFLVNHPYGLAWQASFAAAHGKPISFPEWGLVAKPTDPQKVGGDDPMFIQNMHNWFMNHNTALESYFNSINAGAQLFYAVNGDGAALNFPKALAVYKTLF